MSLFKIRKPRFMQSNAERYRDYLESTIGQSCEVFRDNSLNKKLPHVFTFVFKDYPSNGFISAFTYGISAANQSEWEDTKPELVLSVKSENINWAHALGFIANNLREKCPFQINQVIKFGQQIVEESPENSFIITEQDIIPSSIIQIDKKTTIKLVKLSAVKNKKSISE